MPKLKTHTGASKRFTKTASGLFKRGQSKTRHILTSKETKSKRHLGKSAWSPRRTRRRWHGCFPTPEVWARVSLSLSSRAAVRQAEIKQSGKQRARSMRYGPWELR